MGSGNGGGPGGLIAVAGGGDVGEANGGEGWRGRERAVARAGVMGSGEGGSPGGLAALAGGGGGVGETYGVGRVGGGLSRWRRGGVGGSCRGFDTR